MDGTIRHLSSGDHEVWFDVTATHSTCHSKLRKELRLTKRRKTAGKTGNRMKSAAVLDAHTKKRDKYALLEAIVERQLRKVLLRARDSTINSHTYPVCIDEF